MTLLAEIQSVLERTYRPAGVSLEQCLISRERSRQLDQHLSRSSTELSPLARTYLRPEQNSLYLALYFDPQLITHLEAFNPRHHINHQNIHQLITFIEEITHGLHAALAFQTGWCFWESEQFACNLELQARVDTYWLLLLLGRSLQNQALDPSSRSWIKERLFADENTHYQDPKLARRYRWAQEGARSFVELCEKEKTNTRHAWIRHFRDLSLCGKIRFLRQHHAHTPA
jgi:hypothetical protein